MLSCFVYLSFANTKERKRTQFNKYGGKKEKEKKKKKGEKENKETRQIISQRYRTKNRGKEVHAETDQTEEGGGKNREKHCVNIISDIV